MRKSKRRPKPTVIVTGAVSVVLGVSKTVVGGMSGSTGLSETTLVLFVLSLGFLTGLIVQDVYNRQSWLWHNWRAWTGCFEVESAQIIERPVPVRFDFEIKIKVTRTIEGGSLVVRAYSCTGMTYAPTEFILQREERIFHKGESLTLLVGTQPLTQWTLQYAHEWEDLPPEKRNKWLIANSNNLIEVEMGKGWRRQRERFNLAWSGEPRSVVRDLSFRWEADGAYDLT